MSENFISNFKIMIEVIQDGEIKNYQYQFGTHIKPRGTMPNKKVNLNESEILKIKQNIKIELQKIIDNLGEKV